MSEKEREESFIATVGKGWRITVPIEVRKLLKNLQEGTLVRVTVRREK